MKFAQLQSGTKALREVAIIVSLEESQMVVSGVQEYAKNHKRSKKAKRLAAEMDHVPYN